MRGSHTLTKLSPLLSLVDVGAEIWGTILLLFRSGSCADNQTREGEFICCVFSLSC